MRLPILAGAFVVSTAAVAAELPQRKAGLWEMTMATEGGRAPGQPIQHCTDAATDKKMSALGASMRPNQCSKYEMKQSGGTITIDSVCDYGTGTMVSRAVVTGDFNSGYTVKINSKRQGPPSGMPAETNMTIDARWMGPCKADQKPGDMIMGNGFKMNINDQPNVVPGMPTR